MYTYPPLPAKSLALSIDLDVETYTLGLLVAVYVSKSVFVPLGCKPVSKISFGVLCSPRKVIEGTVPVVKLAFCPVVIFTAELLD